MTAKYIHSREPRIISSSAGRSWRKKHELLAKKSHEKRPNAAKALTVQDKE